MQKWTILAGAAALALSLGINAAPAATSTAHSAASIECSKEADAKGLHGKARKEFRSKCKRGQMSAGSTAGQSSRKAWGSSFGQPSRKSSGSTVGQSTRH